MARDISVGLLSQGVIIAPLQRRHVRGSGAAAEVEDEWSSFSGGCEQRLSLSGPRRHHRRIWRRRAEPSLAVRLLDERLVAIFDHFRRGKKILSPFRFGFDGLKIDSRRDGLTIHWYMLFLYSYFAFLIQKSLINELKEHDINGKSNELVGSRD